MSEHLERETRLAGAEKPDSAGLGASSPASGSQLEAIAIGELSDFTDDGTPLPRETAELIKRCLDGTEPLDRPLKYWEQEKFTARHVNIAMLRVAGFKVGDIAQALGYNIATVSWTLNHPYGKKIVHSLMTARGVRVLDIRTKLDAYASDVLDQMFELTTKSSDLELVSKVGFGLLDRAGYNTTTKVQQVPADKGMASEHTLSRLASALEQSQSVDVHIMPAYVPSTPPENQSQSGVGTFGPTSGRDDTVARSEVDSGFSDGIRLAKVSNE